MDKDLISVIVPIYNVAEYLPRCLDSLRIQTYNNIQVILVNDGSTDKSAEVAAYFCRKDPRFVLINQKNAGQGAARNTGIDAAEGKYLAFVDSDDWVHPQFIEKLYARACENQADIVMCGVERVWQNGTRRKNPASNSKEFVTTDIEEVLPSVSFVIWDKLCRKELFCGVRFPTKMKYEDYAFTPRIIANAKTIAGISDVLYYYFWRTGSTTNTVSLNRDIYKAHKILESSELADRYPNIVAGYFVKMVMGSLIPVLILERGNMDEVKEIMNYGREKYPNLKQYIRKDNIGDVTFGKILFNEHYILAYLLKKACYLIKNILRPIYHKLLRS